jgi:hypothetical protein
VQSPAPIIPEAVYSEDALTQVLGLSEAALRRARRKGALRYSRPGKRPLYLGQWVIDWLKAASKPEGVPA